MRSHPAWRFARSGAGHVKRRPRPMNHVQTHKFGGRAVIRPDVNSVKSDVENARKVAA